MLKVVHSHHTTLLYSNVFVNSVTERGKSMFQIKSATNQPKYRQIIEAVESAIMSGRMEHGQQLPSISELADEQQIARVTVAKAYEDLRQRGVILAQHGKGFYVASTAVRSGLNVFVLFDTLNAYKETLYDAFKQVLPGDTRINLFFHHYNRELFDSLIRDSVGLYNFYVVMPHFDEDVSDTVGVLPMDRLLVIDQNLPKLKGEYAAVYQPFEDDIYNALVAALDRVRLYHRLTLVLAEDPFQYVPASIIAGFKRFGREHGVPCVVAENYSDQLIWPGEAYLLFADRDLIRFIKHVDRKGWQLGQEVGLISYDDTPMKEILKGGITVISTDFAEMGRTAGRLIAERQKTRIANPGGLILRSSL